MGLYKDDDGTAYLLTEDVSAEVFRSMNEVYLTGTAREWLENRPIDGQLSQRFTSCSSLPREH
jgi:hypothetical protein